MRSKRDRLGDGHPTVRVLLTGIGGEVVLYCPGGMCAIETIDGDRVVFRLVQHVHLVLGSKEHLTLSALLKTNLLTICALIPIDSETWVKPRGLGVVPIAAVDLFSSIRGDSGEAKTHCARMGRRESRDNEQSVIVAWVLWG